MFTYTYALKYVSCTYDNCIVNSVEINQKIYTIEMKSTVPKLLEHINHGTQYSVTFIYKNPVSTNTVECANVYTCSKGQLKHV